MLPYKDREGEGVAVFFLPLLYHLGYDWLKPFDEK